MIADHLRVGIERNIRAAPKEIYQLLTMSNGMKEWLCDNAAFEPRPGGYYLLTWMNEPAVVGSILTLEKDRRVRFTWQTVNEAPATLVEVTLTGHHDGSMIHLTHSTQHPYPDWDQHRLKIREFWNSALENLQSVLETGIDLRIAHRPVIGILLEDMNADTADRLGAPVSGGILLGGTASGTDAQAVGLQANDILTEMDGKILTCYQDLFLQLEGRQVGDVIRLTYYRDREKFSTNVTLSQRQMPDHLISTTELSEMVKRQFEAIDEELAGSIGDTNESPETVMIGSPEWTIKTSLAQVIAVERDLHTWISNLLSHHPDAQNPNFGPVSNERLTAILDVYPSILALMEEFIRCQTETSALLSYLPDELVQRKYIYFRIIEMVSDTLTCFREQIQKIHKSIV